MVTLVHHRSPTQPRVVVLASSHARLMPDDTDPTTTTTVAPTTTAVPAQAAALAVRWPQSPKHSYGSRQACILARENGGDYGRSNNPSHFGAYQFDRGTWASAGGDPSHWGSASPAEQDAAFSNYVAKYGYGAWAPYDGC